MNPQEGGSRENVDCTAMTVENSFNILFGKIQYHLCLNDNFIAQETFGRNLDERVIVMNINIQLIAYSNMLEQL